jgi:cytochrome c oxidase subunit 2
VDGEKKKMAAKLDDPSKVWTLDDIMARREGLRRQLRRLPPGQRQGRRPDQAAGRRGRRAGCRQGQADCQVLLKRQNNGAMPAWKQLSDTDIAAVDHLHQEQLVQQDRQLVQPAEVLALRK